MVTSPEDPFALNPYMAPEMPEAVELDRTPIVTGSVWRWLVAAMLIEAAMTGTMITFHPSSPRVRGINIFAVAHLVLSGLLAITFSWFLGRRSTRPRIILIAQLANLLIWLTLVTIIHLCFGIRITAEGYLFLASAVASALLSLIATLVSSRAFRSQVIRS